MTELPTFVEPGTRIVAENGQSLEVTDLTAVGMHGRLYQTRAWAASVAKRKADWEGGSWWRKFFCLPPRGYPTAPMGRLLPDWLGFPL